MVTVWVLRTRPRVNVTVTLPAANGSLGRTQMVSPPGGASTFSDGRMVSARTISSCAPTLRLPEAEPDHPTDHTEPISYCHRRHATARNFRVRVRTGAAGQQHHRLFGRDPIAGVNLSQAGGQRILVEGVVTDLCSISDEHRFAEVHCPMARTFCGGDGDGRQIVLPNSGVTGRFDCGTLS